MTMQAGISRNLQPIVTVIALCLMVGSSIAAIIGLIPFTPSSPIPESVISVYGEQIRLDGTGLYARDSISCAAQARGQDLVTLLVGVPLLAIGVLRARRGCIRGKMLQSGALGYLLYTYGSYAYLCMYNPLFLLYVTLFGLSLYGFIVAFRCFGETEVHLALKTHFKRRLLSGYLIVMGVLLTLMWIARIVPSMIAGGPPVGLEQYTTLVIQASDLAIVVPAAVLTGILLLKQKPLGDCRS